MVVAQPGRWRLELHPCLDRTSLFSSRGHFREDVCVAGSCSGIETERETAASCARESDVISRFLLRVALTYVGMGEISSRQ